MEIIHHTPDFNGFRERYAIVVPRDSSTDLVPMIFMISGAEYSLVNRSVPGVFFRHTTVIRGIV
jgi:hypothetical protein